MIGSRAYNELVGRIEKIANLLFRQVHIIDIIQIGFIIFQQVTFCCPQRCKRGRTLQRLRSDHVITYSAINRKLYYSLTEIRRVLKERSVRRKNQPKE